ncbi:Ctr copper transporter family [Phytophthora infestans]|uniref:Copper transport protein n=1 Tax=Phytophthora infestans TaxID=4787 RepID=A0A8S9V776_PHYIN|nr:Ctr copper transporter family [Phytophthora infestans]
MTSVSPRIQALLVLCATLFALSNVANAMDMDDMPDDPVSGEMVMSKAYNVELNNGQRLRFAAQDTFDAFLKDPQMGLKGVHVASAPSTHHHNEEEKSVLCPVCGMASSVFGGPEVVMKHGDQAVHTCSMTHAREVFEDILSFQAPTEGNTAQEERGFCSGPGTTMLNGFSLTGTSTPCILLWFPGWVLDSRMRYIFGGILVALVAVFNEYLLQLRRVLRKESSVKRLMSSNAPQATESAQLLRSTAQGMPLADSCGPTWFRTLSPETQHGVHSLLHGVTLFVAYMLMLVSMTYDFTLLLWVVAGYVAGHYVFGERREAPLSNGEMESNFP